jgi:hypothetical protein
MELFVERELGGETEVLVETPPQIHVVHAVTVKYNNNVY